MAKRDATTCFQQMLLQFVAEPDPLFAMLQWMTDRLMQIESEAKVGAEKGKHSSTRTTFFSWRSGSTFAALVPPRSSL